jgi:hypothetical protein
MSTPSRAAVVRFLSREERLWRNKVRMDDDPFNRGYNLGQAHALATAIRCAQTWGHKAVASGRAPKAARTAAGAPRRRNA